MCALPVCWLPVSRARAILKGFIELCWFTIKWSLLLTVAAGLVAAPFLFQRIDAEIRSRVEQGVAAKFPHLKVTVRSAQLVKGEGIIIRGLSLRQPDLDGRVGELISIDEVLAVCNTDLTDFLSGKASLRQVIVRRPVIRVGQSSTRGWNIEQLRPHPPANLDVPMIVVEDGSLELYDFDRPESPAMRVREAQLTIQPTIEQPLIAGGRSPLHVLGTCVTDFLRQAKVDALFDLDGRAFRSGGKFESLDIHPRDWESLPSLQAALPELAKNFRARARGEWAVEYLADRTPALEFSAAGQISEGRIDDPRLIYPVTDLRADLSCSQAGLRVWNISARHGASDVRGEFERDGFSERSPLRLTAQARQLSLDTKLLQVLPPKLQSEWHKYMPIGEIDLDAKIAYDGERWTPEVNLHCLNVSFMHYKFPYRLDRGRGTVQLNGSQVQCNLTAYSDNAEARITAQASLEQSPPLGWVEVRGDHVRCDEKLLFALPDKAAKVVRSLHPAGQGNFFYRWSNDPAVAPEPQQFAQIVLNRCSFRVEKFPYAIQDVTGVVEMHNRQWQFRDLRGSHERGRVICNGEFALLPDHTELSMQAVATNVTLDDELREAVSPGVQRVWDALKPRGMMNVAVDLRHHSLQPNMQVWVRAEPVAESMSIEPVQFPYRLEKAKGVFTFADGRVTIEGFKAEHGRATLTARGVGDLTPTGGWTLHFEQFNWDRLVADREFVAALPGRLRKVASDLDIKGPISLHGAVDLSGQGERGDLPTSAWDIHVDFQQTVLNCGVRLDDVNGGLTLAGNFDGQQFRCRGELNIDSLVFRDRQLTEVRGPFYIDDSRLLLGYWADRISEVQQERRLTGRLYGGMLVADGWVNLGGDPYYQLNATLTKADLGEWARQVIPNEQKLTGEAMARIDLKGRGASMNELSGTGTIQLRNANIYELPLMVSLLKVFSTRPPDATAFTTSDIDFRIRGEHFYVDRCEFNGDAISLLGKGEIGMNKQINLAFYAVVGRDENRAPALRTMLGGASKQILQIYAEGTLDQPTVRREAFPGVNQMWQQLQADFQSREATRRGQFARQPGNNLR